MLAFDMKTQEPSEWFKFTRRGQVEEISVLQRNILQRVAENLSILERCHHRTLSRSFGFLEATIVRVAAPRSLLAKLFADV